MCLTETEGEEEEEAAEEDRATKSHDEFELSGAEMRRRTTLTEINGSRPRFQISFEKWRREEEIQRQGKLLSSGMM